MWWIEASNESTVSCAKELGKCREALLVLMHTPDRSSLADDPCNWPRSGSVVHQAERPRKLVDGVNRMYLSPRSSLTNVKCVPKRIIISLPPASIQSSKRPHDKSRHKYSMSYLFTADTHYRLLCPQLTRNKLINYSSLHQLLFFNYKFN